MIYRTMKCKDCIWCDQCGKDEPCENFTPESNEEEDIKNYNEDLMLREEYYSNYVDESGGWFSYYAKDGDI